MSDRFAQLKDVLAEENTTASGLGVTYPPGLLVAAGGSYASHSSKLGSSVSARPHITQNITLGRRLPDALVLCQSDSRPWYLQSRIKSTGQLHLLVFGGDTTDQAQMTGVKRPASSLIHPDSICGQLVSDSAGESVGSLAVYLIHSAPRLKVEFTELPGIFRPYDGQNGYEYRRVFADNASSQEDPPDCRFPFYDPSTGQVNYKEYPG